MPTLPNCEDYEISIDTAQLIKSDILTGGYVEKSADIIVRYVGGFCIVFPFYLKTGKKCAVRCWIANVSDVRERSRLVAEELKRIQLPYFVNFEYIPNCIATNAGVQPIILMDWVEAQNIKEYVGTHLHDKDVLRKLAENFMQMVKCLHRYHISHGDLQHGNILIQEDGSIVLVDYDSMYVPALAGYADEIKGLAGYQHPARWQNTMLSEKADYFSELVIYISIVALIYHPELWDKLQISNTDTFLFSVKDLNNPSESELMDYLLTEGNQELHNLAGTICKELSKKTINDLVPLEEAVVTPFDRIKAKWKEKKPIQTIEFCPDTHQSRKAWNSLPIKEPLTTGEIRNKWNK